jgi:hypothetical protein
LHSLPETKDVGDDEAEELGVRFKTFRYAHGPPRGFEDLRARALGREK